MFLQLTASTTLFALFVAHGLSSNSYIVFVPHGFRCDSLLYSFFESQGLGIVYVMMRTGMNACDTRVLVRGKGYWRCFANLGNETTPAPTCKSCGNLTTRARMDNGMNIQCSRQSFPTDGTVPTPRKVNSICSFTVPIVRRS